MICNNCGVPVSENDRFCQNCGAEVIRADAPAAEPAENNNGTYNENMQTDTAGGYYSSDQGGFYSNSQNNGGYYAGNQQSYWTPPVNDKAPTVKDYLKWMLLYPLINFIPGIGFIAFIVLCFKYALDNSFTARANYFKAMLIAQLVGFAIAIAVIVAMFVAIGTATAIGFSFLEEFDPSYFAHEFQEGIHNFLSVALFK